MAYQRCDVVTGWASAVTFFFIFTSISIPEQVMFSGKMVGESAMVTEEDIGLEIVHVYEVCISLWDTLFSEYDRTVLL